MSYELNRQDIYSFAAFIGAKTKEKGDELHFELCPKCHGGSRKDKYTFGINLEKGAFQCLRATCDYKGHFVELCRDFDYRLEYETPKVYKQLKQPKKQIEPTQAAIDYLWNCRGIPSDVAKEYGITTHKDNADILCFPFFDEAGKMQFIKYRNTKYKQGDKGAKEWCEKDAMPILFGMKQCKNFDRLIITEGQLDSLSVAAAGFNNAVSVPTGAKGFTWLAPCYDWVCKFKELVVFGDYERGEMSLLDTLIKRLGNKLTIKAVRPCDYLGEKDANAILQKYGVTAIHNCIENAERAKIEHVRDLSSVRAVNVAELPKISTGIAELDRIIGGLVMGQVVLLSGRAGEGKSTFMSQLICEALDQGESVFAYSGELADWQFKNWLDYQLAGAEHLTESEGENGGKVYTIEPQAHQAINEWYKGRMFIYDNDYLPNCKEEIEGVLTTVERVVMQYGVRLICIDNLMTAMETVRDKDNLHLAQGNFVSELKRIAKNYDVCIILVAHPRKSAEKDFTNDTVSGSSDIANRVDVVMAYQRADDTERAQSGADSLLQISKNRLFGVLKFKDDAIRLTYSPKTKRIFPVGENVRKAYGWDYAAHPHFEEISIADELPFK